MENLPAEMPQFMRSPQMALDVGEFAHEGDRLRYSGTVFDSRHNTDHFMEFDDTGRTRAGLTADELPETREQYAIILHSKGLTVLKEGDVYYNVLETYEALRRHLGFWRVETGAARTWTDPAKLAWLRQSMTRREWLIKHYIGTLTHAAADATAPLHITVHRYGWGDYPNPNNYTTTMNVHMYAAGEFMVENVTIDDVRKELPPPTTCVDPLAKCLAAVMKQALMQVEPMYRLATDGAFDDGNPRGVQYMSRLTARQSGFVRDLVVRAWHESRNETLGYGPMKLSVQDVEAGKVVPAYEHIAGWD